MFFLQNYITLFENSYYSTTVKVLIVNIFISVSEV